MMPLCSLARRSRGLRKISRGIIFLAWFIAPTVALSDESLVNVLSLLPHSNINVDYTQVINASLKAGRHLLLPNDGMTYLVTDSIQFGENSGLIGQAGTRIIFRHSKTVWRVPAAAANAQMTDIIWDGSSSTAAKDQSFCSAKGFRWVGGGMHFGSVIYASTGCDGALFKDLKIDYSISSGIVLNGGNDDVVSDSEFENNDGFGIFVTNGSRDFNLSDNHSNANAAEMIAVGVKGHQGVITRNYASGMADNCYSLSGDHIVFTKNTGVRCLGHGVGAFGSNNTIVDNRFIDNGQFYNPSAAPVKLYNGSYKSIYKSAGYSGPYYGIAVVGAFGGYAQGDIVHGNWIDDDQEVTTQDGIRVGAGIQLWRPGKYSAHSYAFANGNTYETMADGQATVAPSGTGAFTDPSGLAWNYISTPLDGTREPILTKIDGNTILHWKQNQFLDQRTAAATNAAPGLVQPVQGATHAERPR